MITVRLRDRLGVHLDERRPKSPTLVRPFSLFVRTTQVLTDSDRHVLTYVSSFFSLPVKRSTGERLSHEEVVNKLDDETVAYGAELGTNSAFEELLHVAIKVEKDRYAATVSWLKDLFYGSEFDKER